MPRQFSFIHLLLSFFTFITVLVIIRFVYTDQYHFFFLIWNLFLAWVPFCISRVYSNLHTKSISLQYFIFIIWLLFFPNALYIVTDLVHLQHKTIMPVWFDVILIFSAAMLGIIMAMVSLLRFESYLYKKYRKRIVPAIIAAVVFISCFGVYLGRFLRWNTWDVISNPVPLFIAIAERFIFPWLYMHTWGVTITLSIFFYLLHITTKKLPGFIKAG
jgi:uncharacterized membrane protein